MKMKFYLGYLFFLVGIPAIILASSCKKEKKAEATNIEKDANEFKILKGINIASWLSAPKYTGAQRASFFTEADVQLLSSLGFDHIRINIDEAELWDASGNKIRAYGFDLLHNAIKCCIKYNVLAIVDLYVTLNLRFTNTEHTLYTNTTT